MAKKKHRSIDLIYNNISGESPTRRRGINSVEIGIRVLESLVELEKPSPLKRIAQVSEMDPSQAHRYLASLVNTGLIRQDEHSGLYDLGPRALQVGLAALSRLDPIVVISRAARKLTSERGYTLLLTIWSASGPVVIHWFAGRPPIYTTIAVGSVLPLTTSATGRVFMTYLEANYIEGRLKAEGWKAPLEKNKKLIDIREHVLSHRMASVDGTVAPGLRAYAAPIFGIQDTLLAVLTAVVSDSMPAADDAEMIEALKEACDQLSASLGGSCTSET